MHDILIHGANIVDGSGEAPFTGDLVIDGDTITSVTKARSGVNARRKINADGLTLTPGLIDAHTHYDAQVCWDGLLTSSPEHGVTTVITATGAFMILTGIALGATGAALLGLARKISLSS